MLENKRGLSSTYRNETMLAGFFYSSWGRGEGVDQLLIVRDKKNLESPTFSK